MSNFWDSMDCSPPGSSVHGILQEEYWSGLPFPPPGDLSNPGMEPLSLLSPALTGRLFTPGTSWDKFIQNIDLDPTGFRYNFLRVWSWLRTNAGGVPNTCKSNGVKSFGFLLSGERVSNAWETCLSVGDNSWKRLLIPHNVIWGHPFITKDLLLKDGFASD